MSTNFWDDEEGNAIEQEDTHQSGGGDFEVIPAKTRCLAVIEEISWKKFEDAEETDYIECRWSVLQPEEFANRKIFHKIKVCGNDTSRDEYNESKNGNVIKSAKQMLAAIDKNAGGKLFTLGRKPKDEDLQKHLINKPMLITLQVWKSKDRHGDEISGNWVSMVEPKDAAKAAKKVDNKVDKIAEDDDNDIPF